jgi:hypothetical protein
MDASIPRALALVLEHHVVDSAVNGLNRHDDHYNEADLLMPIPRGENAMTASESQQRAKLLAIAKLLTRHSTKPRDH